MTQKGLVELYEEISRIIPELGKLKNQSLCFCSAMSKDQSGVAELLSGKYAAIRASVFRHSKQMGPQVSFHALHTDGLAGADPGNCPTMCYFCDMWVEAVT